jgi:hypothetical protein
MRTWIPAMLCMLVLPLGLVPLLGYTARAIRVSASDPDLGPPSMRLDRRLLSDGLRLLLAMLLLALPFLLAARAVYSIVKGSGVFVGSGDPFVDAVYSGTATAFLLLLPWALAFLVLGPPNIAAFAITGRLRDLLDPVAAGRRVRLALADWNLVTVVVVTGWTIAILGAAGFCVGVIPAAVYAMLVTAHATSVLAPRASQEDRQEGRQDAGHGARQAP